MGRTYAGTIRAVEQARVACRFVQDDFLWPGYSPNKSPITRAKGASHVKRILNDGTTIFLLRHVHPSGKAAEADSIAASVRGIGHDPKEVTIRVQG